MNTDGLNYCSLAHEMVDTTDCPYCGMPAKVSCMAKPKKGPKYHLAPSRSHRARIEQYWRIWSMRTGLLNE